MDAETASREIVKLRRVAEIEEQRAALLDEEHHLHARLGELQDSFSHTDQEITQELRTIDPRTPPQQPLL